jgi:hypothetical protein
MSSKSLTLIMKSLHSSKNVFRQPQNRSKCLTLMEKTLYHFKKASTPLKMYLKASPSLKKPHFHWRSLSFSENIFKKPPHFYKSLKFLNKTSTFLKMSSKCLEIFEKASAF